MKKIEKINIRLHDAANYSDAHELGQQPDKELCDILDCISQFDDTETLENKGRYFEVIQKDVRKYLRPPE